MTAAGATAQQPDDVQAQAAVRHGQHIRTLLHRPVRDSVEGLGGRVKRKAASRKRSLNSSVAPLQYDAMGARGAERPPVSQEPRSARTAAREVRFPLLDVSVRKRIRFR